MNYKKYFIAASITLLVTGSSFAFYKGYAEHKQALDVLAQIDKDKQQFEKYVNTFENEKKQFMADKSDFEQKKKEAEQKQAQTEQAKQMQQSQPQQPQQSNQSNQKQNDYHAKLAQIDSQIQESKYRAEGLPRYSQAYRDELQKQIDLLDEKNKIIREMSQ